MVGLPTPPPIDEIDDAEKIRILVYASNQPVHAPLIEAVEAGARGRLLPKGGDAGDVLTKTSDDDYDVRWARSIQPHAWVNFDGTGTPAIRDDENVVSITDNGAGDYTVNYGSSASSGASVTITAGDTGTPGTYTCNIVEINTGFVRFQVRDLSGSPVDVDTICVHVFGKAYNFFILSGDEQSGLDKLLLQGDMAPGVLLLTPSQY